MNEEAKAIAETLLGNAGYINAVLVSGMGIFLAGLILRLNGGKELDIKFGKIQIHQISWAIAALTVAHVYTTTLFVRFAEKSLRKVTATDAKLIYEALSDNGPLFFRGMMARTEVVGNSFFGPIIGMDRSDLTVWLAYGSALLVLIVIAWRPRQPVWKYILLVLLALVIILANWITGAQWAVYASCFDTPDICLQVTGGIGGSK